MFKECLDVFLEMLKHEDNLILKGYIPADGSYIIVKQDGTVNNADINFDKILWLLFSAQIAWARGVEA